jgi:ribosome biogenesis GTPase / thiamine phosphate phosphatase
MNLELLGWNSFFEACFAQYAEKGFLPGRISTQHRDRYLIFTEAGEIKGQVSGKFRFGTSGLHDYPAIGDWVAFEQDNSQKSAVIHHVLERKSKFSRKVAGERTDEQILAANIDFAFLVMGLDGDYNPRRLERYLTVAHESSAQPVIILNKSDKCDNAEENFAEISKIASGIDVFLMSAKQGIGIEPVREILKTGVTGVLLGSSGVGKSTITNYLLGKDYAKILDVREDDDRGRHATSHRELLLLPSGGIIIDTPGLREIQLWGGEEGIQDGFEDIIELGSQCRFRDCKHDTEPGCAVKQALENGTLDAGRYESFLKLKREISFHDQRNLIGSQRTEKERWKKVSKQIKTKFRNRDKP